MRKQIATVGLTAALVAGGAGALALTGAGTSSAQTTPDTTTSEPSGRSADHAARLAETLQPLVDDGTLTQDQADAVIAALEAARPDKEHGTRVAEVVPVAGSGSTPRRRRSASPRRS